jgi:hypothetical protein
MKTMAPGRTVLRLRPFVAALFLLAASGWRLSAGQTVAAVTTGDKPIATSEYEVDGVEVALLSVNRVADGTITVKWEYRNKTDAPKELGASFTGMGSSEAFSLNYYAYLTDARARTKYPVLRDERGVPVAARHAGRKVVTLGARKSLSTWAKFGAPPVGVARISIFIPGAQPFEEITIAGSPQ